jgi:hypothetical protein
MAKWSTATDLAFLDTRDRSLILARFRRSGLLLDCAQSFIDYIIEDAGRTIGRPTEYSTQTYLPVP